MEKEILIGLLRHLLTAGGGLLVSKGWIAADGAKDLVEDLVGAAMILAGAVWSVWHKRQQARKCKTEVPIVHLPGPESTTQTTNQTVK